MGGRRKNIEVTFWQRVNKTGPLMPHMDTPCWDWLGCVDRQTGYGRIGILVNNQTIRHAHRYSFQLTRKLIPGLDIMHICDNRICVNPDHLEQGTRKQNMQDASFKGRINGELHRKVKLSEKEIECIRQLSDTMHPLQRDIAKQFNIHQCTVSRILNYQRRRIPSYAP